MVSGYHDPGVLQPGTIWCPVALGGKSCYDVVMSKTKKYLTRRERSTYQRLEDIIGCKWSVAVIAAVHEGVRRPGELQRYIPGISKKILSERLRKLLHFGVLQKEEFDEAVPRVEYRLSPAGEKLIPILDEIQRLGELFHA